MMFTLVPTAMAEGETAVAKVGNDKYEMLQAAVNAATTENSTVTLLKDVTEDITIPTGVTAMLDLSGKTLTNKAGKHTITVENGGKLNISDSVGTGVVDNTSHGKAAIYNKGEVTLNGGTFERSAEEGTYSPYSDGGNSWYTIANYGTMEINTGVTVENAGGYSSMIRNGGDVTADCNLTIEGGNFAGGVNTVKNDSFGVLTINGGNFSNTAQYVIMNWNKAEITAGTFRTLDTASAVLFTSAYGGDANTIGKLSISGGEFKHASDTQEMIVDHYDESNSGAAAVTGGRFDADISKYIPSDYVQSADGTVEKLGESNAVAKVGDTYYKTLADAVTAADNATVTLLKDVTANVTIPADKTITLNLNGHTLVDSATAQDKNVAEDSRKHTITNNGTLTILDSVGTGVVDNVSHGRAALYNAGTIVEIKGGKFTRSVDNSTDATSAKGNSWYVVYNAENATINRISDGEFLAIGEFSSLFCNCGLINEISGGTFTQNGFIAFKNEGTVNKISGGTFSSEDESCIQNWGSIGEITGGTITAGSIGIWNFSSDKYNSVGKVGQISGGNISGSTAAIRLNDYDTTYLNKPSTINKASVAVSGGNISGNLQVNANTELSVSGGSFSQSVERKYLDQSLNAELKRTGGETPYSYYPDVAAAAAAAQPGDTVTDLKATTELKVTLTMKYNDGATADITYNVASGTTITLPTPAHRSGYTFNGWYDGSKFYAAGASYKVSVTATLNASWSYISSGSSSYDPTYSVSTPSKTENGTVTVSPKSASKGDTVTVTVKPDSGYVLETLTVTDKNGNELTLKDKGDGKYTFTMPAGKVEVKATFMEDNSVLNFFYDVPNGAYFYEAVKWAVKSGVTNGLSDTMFGPYESCTRAQIVTFLWRAAGSPEPKTASSFTDVPVSTYYAKAVAWAVENGITNGMTATEFAPDATCTRGQSVTFLYRALGKKVESSANFTDVKSDAFYADAINWAVANNVTNGTSNTTFSPNADCTRAEIVTFLYRAYQGK